MEGRREEKKGGVHDLVLVLSGEVDGNVGRVSGALASLVLPQGLGAASSRALSATIASIQLTTERKKHISTRGREWRWREKGPIEGPLATLAGEESGVAVVADTDDALLINESNVTEGLKVKGRLEDETEERRRRKPTYEE